MRQENATAGQQAGTKRDHLVLIKLTFIPAVALMQAFYAINTALLTTYVIACLAYLARADSKASSPCRICAVLSFVMVRGIA